MHCPLDILVLEQYELVGNVIELALRHFEDEDRHRLRQRCGHERGGLNAEDHLIHLPL